MSIQDSKKGFALACLIIFADCGHAADLPRNLLPKPGLFKALTEPPCSYCSTQHRKNLIKNEDRVVAWLRGPHNGGAISIRHFLSSPPGIKDTYGVFFYDPDGGYVRAVRKDYGYGFFSWRSGATVL